jgi:tRNA (guanine37-N1)-methyltransferase
VIYLSPQGVPLKAQKCRQLATESHLILLCGHYEGIDERILKEVDEEISIGDFVLTNGCLAACVLIDSVVRFLPGVVGDEQSVAEDSFERGEGRNGLLHWPQFTRPEEFEGDKVPEVLLSGNHKEIQCWREEQALKKTKRVRPDLLG